VATPITYTVTPYQNGAQLKTAGLSANGGAVRFLNVSLVSNPSTVGSVNGQVANIYLGPITFALFGASMTAGGCHVTFAAETPIPSFSF
jgi:hypothetical protein